MISQPGFESMFSLVENSWICSTQFFAKEEFGTRPVGQRTVTTRLLRVGKTPCISARFTARTIRNKVGDSQAEQRSFSILFTFGPTPRAICPKRPALFADVMLAINSLVLEFNLRNCFPDLELILSPLRKITSECKRITPAGTEGITHCYNLAVSLNGHCRN